MMASESAQDEVARMLSDKRNIAGIFRAAAELRALVARLQPLTEQEDYAVPVPRHELGRLLEIAESWIDVSERLWNLETGGSA